MRDLLREPLWKPGDLGKPIPDSEHAVSVCLPTWADVVGYERKQSRVMKAMQAGYPRFFCHPYPRELFEAVEAKHGEEGERAVVFPSRGAAERCAAYVKRRARVSGRLVDFGKKGLCTLFVPEKGLETALKYWQHTGEIVSSRLASVALEKETGPSRGDGEWARQTVCRRIGDASGQGTENVYLVPSGMAAVFTVHRILEGLYPKRKCLQLEFPYVDVMKVQEQFGAGVVFMPLDESGDLREFEKLIQRRKFSAVYCELASNPLLRTVDILRLAEVLRKHDVPLIADDTVGTVHNIDAYRAADVVTTSLTKYYSGVGNLLAGSITLRADSRFRKVFAKKLKEMDWCDLWDADAIILEQNSRDFARRMARLNENGEALFEYLNAHPRVKQVWYPKNQTREIYDSIRREGGGYGALMSIVLKNAPRVTRKFYDALRVSKGPSLGTNYSLACPYTLLAHYNELDWAEECGVSRHLVRISVGLEDKKDLIKRFEKAFKAAAA